MPDPHPLNPLADARAQAVRRILELRGEAPSADTVDLRALLSRTNEANASVRELSAVLPTRLEAAIQRALGDDLSGVGPRLESVHATGEEIADTVARVERDLVAERLGRIEDMEALVALISGGISAIRADLSELNGRVAALAERVDAKAGAAAPPPESPPTAGSRHAYRSLFARTEPRAGSDSETAAEQSA
jgi:hypothetical protein